MTTTHDRPSPTLVPRRPHTSATRIHLARRIAQLTVAGVVLWQVVSRSLSGGHGSEGLCPFGGFETFWTWVTTGRTVQHTHPSSLALAAAVLLVALVGRSFFCGWLCPMGAIQGAVHAATSAVVARIPVLRRLRRRVNQASRRPGSLLRAVDRVARYGRFLVLGWALLGAAYYGYMVFREVDPWVALLNVAEFEFSLAFTVLLIVLVLSMFVRRPFCRYACPLGAVQGIVAAVSPIAVQRDASACLGCDLCSRACPMGIAVHERTRVTDTDCIACLECVAACPSQNALGVRAALPLPVGAPTASHGSSTL